MPQFKINLLNRHLLVAFGGTIFTLAGLQSAQAQQTDTVTITGSGIKRSIESQQALPVTVFSMEELRSVGVTSTEEILQRVTASQSTQGASQSIGSSTGGGSYANMRGLGSNKTLVLLNGRRLAFFGIGASSVDLNAIPFAALERVEILRDGASAVYGTDAVGGVINFITKRDYKGFDVAVEKISPSGAGGGSQRITLSAGKGDLQEDGYNFWFSMDNKKQDSVAATQRDFAKTGVIPSAGLALTSGTTFPANFNYTKLAGGGLGSGNITSPNCAPPGSIHLSGTTCRYDYTSSIDIIPQTDNTNLNAKGSFRLGADKLLTVEAVHSENVTVARVAPDPVTGLTMPITSTYYPRTYAGIDPTKGLTGIGWRMSPGGQRENTSTAIADRLVVDLSGVAGDWDYKSGFFTTTSKVSDGPTNGYVNKSMIQNGITSGLLNPFGDNTQAGLAAIQAAKAFGTFSTGKGTATGIDARFNRELFKMDGGAAQLSLGGELRREGYSTDTNDDLVNNVPSAGRSPYHVNDASRTVTALMAEALLPVSKQLELQAAARMDRYSDFGTTFNPKVGFRYTATPTWLLRGSANTGFRAPSLDDIYGPQSRSFTNNSYNDPVLCPGGVVSASGIASRDCGQQSQALQGGNPNGLKPETSKSFSLGTAFQPAKNLLITVDYWNIQLEKQIQAFPEQAIFADPAKYANRIVRCNTLGSAEQALWDACGVQAGSNAIAYIKTLTDNLGNVKTNGLDVSAAWSTLIEGVGRLGINYDGTYVNSYQYQREIGGAYVENAGKYVDSAPIFRWKHNVITTLNSGNMRYSMGVRYLSGYTDENADPDYPNQVKAYTLVDLGMSYTGVKNLVVSAGLRNALNAIPPFSNQSSTFQKGYDPRFTDSLGRALALKVSYKFF
jgi:iron complex outermembrane receptor protein